MKRAGRFNLVVALIVSIWPAGLAAAQKADKPARCAQAAIGQAQVAAIRDGRIVLLADGREVRRFGIETAGDGEALRRLVGGQTLRLEQPPGAGGNSDRDRYGRVVALAFLPEAAASVQNALLSEGAARVSAHAGGKACADALLAAEKAARTARKGRWAAPNFAPLAAENLTQLAAVRGHFALVEGRV